MKNRLLKTVVIVLCATVIAGCSQSANKNATTGSESEVSESVSEDTAEDNSESQMTLAKTDIPDGEYMVDFKTDSGMFHVNEAMDGKGKLIVKDGYMMLHISLPSKNILNLYPGLAEDAKKEGAVLLEPTIDEVTYSDGMTDEVHGFDVPLPVLDEEFDLALIGTKGKWYDHKVIVSSPDGFATDGAGSADLVSPADLGLADGSYTCDISFEGGTGRASITSPCEIVVSDGKILATIEWSSDTYDYMLVDGQKYEPVNTEGNSTFEIPAPGFDAGFMVVADTVAMSTPHEIEYEFTLHSETVK